MSMRQIGTAVLNPGTDDESWGLCESQEIAQEGNKIEVDNGAGDTVGLIYTNVGKKKFSGTYTPLAAAEATDPVKADDLIGQELTVTTATGVTLVIHIDSATFSRKKGAVSEFKIDGYYYPNVTTAAAPAATPQAQ